MERIIDKEPITFGSRLDQLMKEQKITNEDVAKLLPHCSKTTVSNWRTGKHDLRRHKKEYCSILADLFDVDPEYLMCTQLPRRRKHKEDEDDSIGQNWFNPVNGRFWDQFDSVQEKREVMKRVKKNQKKLDDGVALWKDILAVFNKLGIHVFPDTSDEGDIIRTQYKFLNDGVVYTIEQEEDNPRYTGKCAMELPDGSLCIRTPEEIMEIYQSLKEYLINTLMMYEVM